MPSAGLISLAAYLPGQEIAPDRREPLASYLRRATLLPPEYIDPIEKDGRLPGQIETNYDGWESQPWFEAWLRKLPPKRREDPFRGTVERRRFPIDPLSLRESVHPHPMLSSDAETLAGALAIFNGGINPDEIDQVLVSSLVPDRPVPLNASLLQHKLGLRCSGAYNVDTCCSSFVTMLEVASSLVLSGIRQRVLIVASSGDSHINDKSTYQSPDTGDAAAAGVVARVDDGYGYLGSHATSHGRLHAAIVFERRRPELLRTRTYQASHEQEFVTFSDPSLIKEVAVHTQEDVLEVVQGALARAHLTLADVHFLVTHQPVAWAAGSWRANLDIPEERFYESFEQYGNIANCCVPVNLLEALQQGRTAEGDNVLLMSPGVGANHIALLHRTPPELVAAAGAIHESPAPSGVQP